VQLTALDEEHSQTIEMMDMLLSKKRSGDRKEWLQAKGDMAVVQL
jgi:topoisomerase-4 subunit B